MAEERLAQARAAFGPTVTLTAGYTETRLREAPTYATRPLDGRNLALRATQPLLQPALFAARDSTEAQVE